MKIMIVSDSHAMPKETLITLLSNQKVDAYIHCGDIFMTYDGITLPNFYLARGNNDFGDIPKELTITLDSKRFFICHGHHYYVDYDLDSLLTKAKEVNADVVCYGHTHIPFYKKIDSIVVINPGSLSYPRGAYRHPTYCILDTQSMKTTFFDATTGDECHPFMTKEKQKFSFKNFFK